MGEAVTDQPAFIPEPLDPDAEGADAIPRAWDPEDWPEMADAAAPDAVDDYVPFADRVPEAPLPVAAGHELFADAGPTTHDNHLGNYAMFFGVVAFAATAVLYLWGAGLWWLDVVLGGIGAYYGVRGFKAASRGRATNRSSAVVGGLMGLVGAIAAAVYLVVVAFALTRALSQF